MFQSPDGDFVYSDRRILVWIQIRFICFNPLTGISSILTYHQFQIGYCPQAGFNPLTGISSILTNLPGSSSRFSAGTFQSPDGDFVYSDLTSTTMMEPVSTCFNPLTGISSILTNGDLGSRRRVHLCFNPLTGISSILTDGSPRGVLQELSVSIP